MSTRFAMRRRVTSLLHRPTLDSFAPRGIDVAEPPFDADAELADARAYLRLGLNERALETAVLLLLRGVPLTADVTALIDAYLPEERVALWVDAVSFASIGLRAKGLACVAGALSSRVHEPECAGGLRWTLSKLGLTPPATNELPLIEGALDS